MLAWTVSPQSTDWARVVVASSATAIKVRQIRQQTPNRTRRSWFWQQWVQNR